MQMRVKSFGRMLVVLSLLAAAAPIELASATAPAARQEQSERYVRAKTGGAKLLNYRDVQSSVWRTVPGGEVLRVTGEQVLEPPGQPKLVFLEVEVPGGLPVWVFGQYLEATGTPGLVRTTTSVRMRPKPSSDQSSMAHPMTLARGEVVRFIERASANKPMNEDWVKVWSPESARAWVLERETEPAADVAAARAEWNRASALLRGDGAPAEASATLPVNASAGSSDAADAAKAAAGGDDASKALDAARARYEAALAGDGADIEGVVAAYEKAIELAPAGSALRRQAEHGLEQAKSYAEIVAVRAKMQEADAERARLLEELDREEQLEERRNDPLWGRFLARGWVVARTKDGERRYFVSWKNEDVCELVCGTGRYDLALFQGYEIGVMGTVSRGAVEADDVGPAQPKLLDVYRVEVISGAGASK